MARQNDNPNGEFNYEIKERIALLSTNENGWTKELNILSFHGDTPKYDVRDWSPDHSRMTKGIRLTEEEIGTLAAAIADRYIKTHEEEFKRPEWTPEPVKQEIQTRKQEADIVPFRVRRNDPQPLAPAPEKPKTEMPKRVKQSAPVRKSSKINVPADIKLPF